MYSHRKLFTEYLKWRAGDRNVYGFIDWRLDKELYQCENCKRYGSLGDEVSYIDDSNLLICWDCRVKVWGWYQKDLFLGGECFRGHEVEFLLEQAKSFGVDAPSKKYIEWGYEKKGE